MYGSSSVSAALDLIRWYVPNQTKAHFVIIIIILIINDEECWRLHGRNIHCRPRPLLQVREWGEKISLLLRRLFGLSSERTRLSFSSYEETTITFRTADLSPKCSWILCSYRKMEVFVIVTNNNIPICHWGTLEDIQFRGTTG